MSCLSVSTRDKKDSQVQQCGVNGHISQGGRDEQSYTPLSAGCWPHHTEVGAKEDGRWFPLGGSLSKGSGGEGRQHTRSTSCVDEESN